MFLELARKQVFLFELDNVSYMRTLVNAQSIRNIMIGGYNSLLVGNKLTPIESLPPEQKTTMWETAKEIAVGKLDTEKLIELCKALCCLEYMLNNK